MDNMQLNNKYRLYGNEDETINSIVSERSKISTERIQEQLRLSGKGDLLEIMQETEISLN